MKVTFGKNVNAKYGLSPRRVNLASMGPAVSHERLLSNWLKTYGYVFSLARGW